MFGLSTTRELTSSVHPWLENISNGAYQSEVLCVNIKMPTHLVIKGVTALVEALNKNPRINTLKLFENSTDAEITKSLMNIVAQAKHITKLYLGFDFITDDGIAHLTKMPQLALLQIECGISTQLITREIGIHLKKIPHLVELRLSRHNLSEDDLIFCLKQIPQLESLEISNVKFTRQGIAKLAQIGLRNLCFAGSTIGSIVPLLGSNTLRSLKLWNHVEEKELKILADNKMLTEFWLPESMGDQLCQQIEKNCKLNKISSDYLAVLLINRILGKDCPLAVLGIVLQYAQLVPVDDLSEDGGLLHSVQRRAEEQFSIIVSSEEKLGWYDKLCKIFLSTHSPKEQKEEKSTRDLSKKELQELSIFSDLSRGSAKQSPLLEASREQEHDDGHGAASDIAAHTP